MAGIVLRVKVDKTRLEQMQAQAPGIDSFINTLAADQALNAAVEIVPVRTGFLRSTIRAESAGSLWLVEASAGYASFVEYGTHRMAAQPYMRPALEAVDWDGILNQAVWWLGL